MRCRRFDRPSLNLKLALQLFTQAIAQCLATTAIPMVHGAVIAKCPEYSSLALKILIRIFRPKFPVRTIALGTLTFPSRIRGAFEKSPGFSRYSARFISLVNSAASSSTLPSSEALGVHESSTFGSPAIDCQALRFATVHFHQP